jgi:hypothetical protein
MRATRRLRVQMATIRRFGAFLARRFMSSGSPVAIAASPNSSAVATTTASTPALLLRAPPVGSLSLALPVHPARGLGPRR